MSLYVSSRRIFIVALKIPDMPSSTTEDPFLWAGSIGAGRDATAPGRCHSQPSSWFSSSDLIGGESLVGSIDSIVTHPEPHRGAIHEDVSHRRPSSHPSKIVMTTPHIVMSPTNRTRLLLKEVRWDPRVEQICRSAFLIFAGGSAVVATLDTIYLHRQESENLLNERKRETSQGRNFTGLEIPYSALRFPFFPYERSYFPHFLHLSCTSCAPAVESHSPRDCPPSEELSVTRNDIVVDSSWFRRTLNWFRVWDLPLPRIVRPGDSSLKVPARLLKQRERDEHKLRELQKELEQLLERSKSSRQGKATNNVSKSDQQLLGSLATQQYQILYGPNVTPQDRMDFLAQYGCTAWTSPCLQRLVQLGEGRGFVEVGAGHGQWARAIEEERRTRLQLQRLEKAVPNAVIGNHVPRDFVLAYDDWSRLPLDPTVYHPKTRPHAAYFGKVHRLNREKSISPAESLSVLLSQWKHRGRILLLVYPTPALAIQSLEAYSAMGPENDTVVYVGEGRGGANASDDFFDFLETSGDDRDGKIRWVLLDVLQVRPFGTKGFEQLYIFQKMKENDQR